MTPAIRWAHAGVIRSSLRPIAPVAMSRVVISTARPDTHDSIDAYQVSWDR
jgi:hypothetical protein